jgi:zinc transporter 14
VWGYGILFVTLISLCSLVGVSVLPLMGKAFYSKLLTVLIGLAVGSLSGSSVFHLIPQAFGLMNSDPDHHYLRTSVLLFSGVWLFFMIERFLKIIMDWKEKKNQLKRVVNNPVAALSLIAESPGPVSALSADVEKIYESQEQVIKASFGHQAVKFKVFELKFWENHNFIFYKFRNHNEDIAMSA